MNHRLVVNCALALSLTIGLHGASSAKAPSIDGHVVDAAGQPIPGAFVTAMSDGGGALRQATTGVDGAYQFANVPEGTYRVDFDIRGFDLSRRNHVRVRQDAPAVADATLFITAICECVNVIESTELGERAGQVLDQPGQPLAHARLEIAAPLHQEVNYADKEGRFRVRVPMKEKWMLTVSDSGYGPIRLPISWSAGGPIVLRLPHADTKGLPDTERLRRPCCPGHLFTDDGR